MIDRTTKSLLAVIAAALSVIAIRGAGLTPARAQDDTFCGSIINPCYIDFNTNVGVPGFPMEIVK